MKLVLFLGAGTTTELREYSFKDENVKPGYLSLYFSSN